MKKLLFILAISIVLVSCSAVRRGSMAGGEVTGVGASTFSEPTPYGMVLVDCGSMREGPAQRDSVWGLDSTAHGVSVDAFWMDETEISNSKYKQFVYWVRDSIIRERLADPAYGGNEEFKIEEDKEGISTGVKTFPGRTPARTRSEPSTVSTASTPSPVCASSTPRR